jgi:hypothetical protein
MTLRDHIELELAQAQHFESAGDPKSALHHLKRSHILGQSITYEHTRVHWRMLKLGWRARSPREVLGQLFRIAGASTKTPLGIYPLGNTGATDVSPFKPMPIPEDLQAILRTRKN